MTMYATWKDEMPDPPADMYAQPTAYARERIAAALGLIKSRVNLQAVAYQLALASRALKAFEDRADRQTIRGWRSF